MADDSSNSTITPASAEGSGMAKEEPVANEPVQDSGELEVTPEGGNASEAVEAPKAGLESESAEVPSQIEAQAEANLDSNKAKTEPIVETPASEPAQAGEPVASEALRPTNPLSVLL